MPAKLGHVFVLTLLGAGPVLAQTARPHPLMAAHWQVGQLWRVEYVRSAPSPVQAPTAALPRAERSIWAYQVMHIEPGEIRIEAVEQGEQPRFELWFNAPIPTLRRVVKVIDNRRIDVIVHPRQTSYFGWSPAYPLIFDWPVLPQSRATATKHVTDDDGQNVAESIRFTSPSQFEVTMMLRRKIDAGYIETRRSSQTWKVGDPWWSEASIRTESLVDGKKSDETNIRGKLIH